MSNPEIERIRKLNAVKAWGHKDSAVEHVAKLLQLVDEQARHIRLLEAEVKRLREARDAG